MNQVTDLAQAALSIEAGLPMRVSPLQVAQAAAALSGGGDFRSASLVSAVNTPGAGWVPLKWPVKPVQPMTMPMPGTWVTLLNY